MKGLTIVCAGAVSLALMLNLAAAQPPGGRGMGGGGMGRGGMGGGGMGGGGFGGADFGGRGFLGGDFGGRGMPGGRSGSTAPTDQPAPLGKSDQEKKILAVLDEMDRNERAGMMNVPVVDGRLLRMLVEAVGAKHVVEIGASNGYSGIWICLGLINTGGKLTTHEIDSGRAALAKKNYARAGVEEIVTLVFGDAHQEVTKIKEPIDVLFIDADKEGYPDYLEKLLPLVRPGGMILAHNVDMGDRSLGGYLEEVTTNPDLETILLNVRGSSLGMTIKKREAPQQ